MKDVKKYSLYLIAIVGLVAIVGIVVMTTNFGVLSVTTEVSEESVTATEETEDVDLAGQAIVKSVSKPECKENDGGNKITIPGIVAYRNNPNQNYIYFNDKLDTAKTGKVVIEGFCSSGKIKLKVNSCQYGYGVKKVSYKDTTTSETKTSDSYYCKCGQSQPCEEAYLCSNDNVCTPINLGTGYDYLVKVPQEVVTVAQNDEYGTLIYLPLCLNLEGPEGVTVPTFKVRVKSFTDTGAYDIVEFNVADKTFSKSCVDVSDLFNSIKFPKKDLDDDFIELYVEVDTGFVVKETTENDNEGIKIVELLY